MPIEATNAERTVQGRGQSATRTINRTKLAAFVQHILNTQNLSERTRNSLETWTPEVIANAEEVSLDQLMASIKPLLAATTKPSADTGAHLQKVAGEAVSSIDGNHDMPAKAANATEEAPEGSGDKSKQSERFDWGIANPPDFEMARKFLATLGTHHTYQTFDDTKGRKLANLARVINGDAGDEVMHTLFNLNADGAGIFVTVNATDAKGRKASNIARTRAIFADFDEPKEGQPGYSVPGYAVAQFEAAAAKLPPTIVVESSPGKRHAYWLCDMKPEDGDALQYKMPEAVGCDPAAKDVARVLRIPGFYHRKGDPVQVKLLQHHPERTYEAWEITNAFGLDSIQGKVKPKAKVDRASTRSVGTSAGIDYDPLDYAINERDAGLLRLALKVLDARDRDTWIAVCGALCRSGAVGDRIFCDWAATAGEAGGYVDDDDCIDKLREMEPTAASNYPAIFTMAKAKGWVQGAVVSIINFDKATPPPDTPPRSVINAPDPFPGLHSKLTTAILAASYIPQPNLASLCSLIALAALSGGSAYTDGTRCNLFGALLSESSSGKEKPVECAQAAVIEGNVPVLSTPASGEALEDALPTGPVLMIMREAAHIFRVMSGDNAAAHAVSLARMILDLFSAGERDKYLKRLKAGQREQDRVAVANPALSVLLASTPGKLGEALSTDNIGDGLLGRLLYAEGDPGAERQRQPVRFKVPAELGFVEDWIVNLTMSEAADELLWQMTLGFDAERKVLLKKDDRATAALLGRRAEKIKRIAGTLGVCAGGTVTAEMVAWAGKFCEASDAVLLSFTEEHLDKSKDIRDTDKVMAAARGILAGTVKTSRAYYDGMVKAGYIPRALCLKASHLSKAKFDLAVLHLIDIDALALGTYEGKTAFCLGT